MKRLTTERLETAEDASPEGWLCIPLAEVIVPVPNAKPEDEPNRDFGYVDISSIDNTTFRIVDAKRLKGRDAPSRARRPIKPGDVLFSNVRTYLRNIAVVPETADLHLCSTGFTVLRSNGAIDPTFLFRYVLTDDFLDRVTPQQTGTHYPATSDRVVMAEVIPLPPLAEQKRIVAKLEELLVRVNAARERLARMPAILKRFRQAVLAVACEGRLTEEWRKTALDTEPAAVLLNRLSKARHSQWAAPQRRYPEPSTPDESSSDSLPEGWVPATVSQLSWLDVGPAFKSSEFTRSGLRLLRGENVEPGRLRWYDTKYWPSNRIREYERFLVEKGQVILALDRPIVSAGLKIAMVSLEDVPCLLVQRVMRFRVIDAALSDYLFLCLQEGRFEAALTGGMTGSDLPHVTGSVVADFTIPLPSLNEQGEIVRRVEALFKLADAIEKRVAMATARAEKLTQAILAKAFRGELVLTEAELARREGREYEPAADLLRRISLNRSPSTALESAKGRGREG